MNIIEKVRLIADGEFEVCAKLSVDEITQICRDLRGAKYALDIAEQKLAAMESQKPAGKAVKWLNSNTAICSGEGLAAAAIDADIFFKPAPADNQHRCAECGPVDAGLALYCVKCWESAHKPAVAVPDGFALVPIERSYDMRTAAFLHYNTAKQNGKDHDDALDAAWRATIAKSYEPEVIAAAPSHSQQSAQRITVQDMYAIVTSVLQFQEDYLGFDFDIWLDGEERTGFDLLDKLNADRCPSHESEQGGAV